MIEELRPSVFVDVDWPGKLVEKSGRPGLWVRLAPVDEDEVATRWPPKEAGSGDRVVLPDTPAGVYRLHAWTADGRWVAAPVLVNVETDGTERARLILERGRSLEPWLDAGSVAPDGETLTLALVDSRGVC